MKILITNIVTLNAGDAAILYAMIDLLRDALGKDAEIIVYDNHGECVRRYYSDIPFRRLLYFNVGSYRLSKIGRVLHVGRLMRVIDRVRFHLGLWSLKHRLQFIAKRVLTSVELRDLLEYISADLIVSSGGTYLVENYSLSPRIFDYKVSLYLGRPLMFFTQSIGPFSTPSHRRSFTKIFQESLLVLLRDEKSLKNLHDLGVRSANIRISADAAFALADPIAIEAAQNTARSHGTPLKVAVSVREWRHFKTTDPAIGFQKYVEAVRAACTHLVESRGAEITFISTCQGIKEYWTDDSKVASRIIEGLPDSVRRSIVLDSDFHHPKELTQILRKFDLVIATRMHMAILALGVGTPVLPLAYEFKIQELFERLGHGRWVQDLEKIEAESLTKALDSFLNCLPQIRKSLFVAVQQEREQALKSADVIKEVYERWQGARKQGGSKLLALTTRAQ